MEKSNNTKLYFQGFLGRALQFIGTLTLFVGFIFLITYSFQWWIGISVFVVGIIILIYGNVLRFKFKRRSGYLIYN